MNKPDRFPISRVVAALLALTLILPDPALALRTETTTEAGVEEQLQLALADSADPLNATAQVITNRMAGALGISRAHSVPPAAGAEGTADDAESIQASDLTTWITAVLKVSARTYEDLPKFIGVVMEDGSGREYKFRVPKQDRSKWGNRVRQGLSRLGISTKTEPKKELAISYKGPYNVRRRPNLVDVPEGGGRPTYPHFIFHIQPLPTAGVQVLSAAGTEQKFKVNGADPKALADHMWNTLKKWASPKKKKSQQQVSQSAAQIAAQAPYQSTEDFKTRLKGRVSYVNNEELSNLSRALDFSPSAFTSPSTTTALGHSTNKRKWAIVAAALLGLAVLFYGATQYFQKGQPAVPPDPIEHVVPLEPEVQAAVDALAANPNRGGVVVRLQPHSTELEAEKALSLILSAGKILGPQRVMVWGERTVLRIRDVEKLMGKKFDQEALFPKAELSKRIRAYYRDGGKAPIGPEILFPEPEIRRKWMDFHKSVSSLGLEYLQGYLQKSDKDPSIRNFRAVLSRGLAGPGIPQLWEEPPLASLVFGELSDKAETGAMIELFENGDEEAYFRDLQDHFDFLYWESLERDMALSRLMGQWRRTYPNRLIVVVRGTNHEAFSSQLKEAQIAHVVSRYREVKEQLLDPWIGDAPIIRVLAGRTGLPFDEEERKLFRKYQVGTRLLYLLDIAGVSQGTRQAQQPLKMVMDKISDEEIRVLNGAVHQEGLKVRRLIGDLNPERFEYQDRFIYAWLNDRGRISVNFKKLVAPEIRDLTMRAWEQSLRKAVKAGLEGIKPLAAGTEEGVKTAEELAEELMFRRGFSFINRRSPEYSADPSPQAAALFAERVMKAGLIPKFDIRDAGDVEALQQFRAKHPSATVGVAITHAAQTGEVIAAAQQKNLIISVPVEASAGVVKEIALAGLDKRTLVIAKVKDKEEAEQAGRAGSRGIELEPAVGGKSTLGQIQEFLGWLAENDLTFPQIEIWGSAGGINADNAGGFLERGYVGFSVGPQTLDAKLRWFRTAETEMLGGQVRSVLLEFQAENDPDRRLSVLEERLSRFRADQRAQFLNALPWLPDQEKASHLIVSAFTQKRGLAEQLLAAFGEVLRGERDRNLPLFDQLSSLRLLMAQMSFEDARAVRDGIREIAMDPGGRDLLPAWQDIAGDVYTIAVIGSAEAAARRYQDDLAGWRSLRKDPMRPDPHAELYFLRGENHREISEIYKIHTAQSSQQDARRAIERALEEDGFELIQKAVGQLLSIEEPSSDMRRLIGQGFPADAYRWIRDALGRRIQSPLEPLVQRRDLERLIELEESYAEYLKLRGEEESGRHYGEALKLRTRLADLTEQRQRELGLRRAAGTEQFQPVFNQLMRDDALRGTLSVRKWARLTPEQAAAFGVKGVNAGFVIDHSARVTDAAHSIFADDRLENKAAYKMFPWVGAGRGVWTVVDNALKKMQARKGDLVLIRAEEGVSGELVDELLRAFGPQAEFAPRAAIGEEAYIRSLPPIAFQLLAAEEGFPGVAVLSVAVRLRDAAGNAYTLVLMA